MEIIIKTGMARIAPERRKFIASNPLPSRRSL